MDNGGVAKTSWATIWVQPNGPNTVPQSLGCYNLDSISESYGGVSPIFCQDPVTPGRFARVGVTQDPPDLPTTSLEGLMGKTQDYMEAVAARQCPVGLYVTFAECPPKNVFLNFDRGNVIEEARLTSRDQSPNASRDADESVMISFDVTALLQQVFFAVQYSRRTTTNDMVFNDIWACGLERCQGVCDSAQEVCDILYAAGVADAGVTAPVWRSANGGATWAATATDPFAADEDIASGVCVTVNQGVTRVIVARGTTDGANPAEIGYSEDAGATWSLVDVGAVNGEFVIAGGGLFALNMRNIWMVTNLGNIYFSDDAGATWTDQVSGQADDLLAVKFENQQNGIAVGGTTGASHVLLKTTDGGTHWTAVTYTGPGATVMTTACEIIDINRWWVGHEDGSVYYTINGGTAFSARTIAVPTGLTAWGQIQDIVLVPGDLGYGLWLCGHFTKTATGYGFIQRTVNGGYDWENFSTVALDTNTYGLTSLVACSINHALAVGAVATTSMISDVVNI